MLPAVRPISLGRLRILPPPWPPVPAAESRVDPLRVLRDDGDRLGIDRRAAPRDGATPIVGDGRLTAAVHRPCPVVFGLVDRGRWALVKGLSRAPNGLLVELLDPFDRDNDVRDRVGVLGLRALGRVAGPRERPASPLWLVSSCVQARALVDVLARRPATGGARSIELAPLLLRSPDRTRGPWIEIPALATRIAGELMPLTDPRPGVLAIAVSPGALASLDALLTPRAPAPPAPAPRPRKAQRAPRSRKTAVGVDTPR
jgi:hypothetical protein